MKQESLKKEKVLDAAQIRLEGMQRYEEVILPQKLREQEDRFKSAVLLLKNKIKEHKEKCVGMTNWWIEEDVLKIVDECFPEVKK